MKKLMVAALVAAMGGVAMATDCAELKCPFAYRIKLAGKTVVAAKAHTNVSDCAEFNCFVKPGSLRIAGYLFGEGGEGGACGEGCACSAIAGSEEGKFDSVFWNEKKVQVEITAEQSLIELLRNSGAKNKIQMAWDLTVGEKGKLVLAGFGAFNPVTKMVKNANGFFAGVLDPVSCKDAGLCGEDGETNPAMVFVPCTPDTAAASEGSIAFGRWNMAYKSAKVAELKAAAKTYTNPWGVRGILIPNAYEGKIPGNN